MDKLILRESISKRWVDFLPKAQTSDSIFISRSTFGLEPLLRPVFALIVVFSQCKETTD